MVDETNGHGPRLHAHNPPEDARMTDKPNHAHNGSEVTVGSNVDERARLENKPILEWTRDDWQLWAAGLNDSQGEPVQPEPVRRQPAPEPVPVAAAMGVVDLATEVGVETDAPPAETALATASVTSEVAAQDVPVDAHESLSSARPEASPAALQRSPGLSAAKPWSGSGSTPPKAPVETARTRARSAMGLIVLAVVVGALVAGLVTFVIMVTSLVLRRAIGA